MKKQFLFILLVLITRTLFAQVFFEYFSSYGVNLNPQEAPFSEQLTYYKDGLLESNTVDTGKLYLGEGLYQNLQIGYKLKNGLQFSVQGRMQKPKWNFGFVHKKNTIDRLLCYDITASEDNPDLLTHLSKSFSVLQYGIIPQIGYYRQFGKWNAGISAGLNMTYTEINFDDYYYNKDPYSEQLIKEVYFNTGMDFSYQFGIQCLYNLSDHFSVLFGISYHPLTFKPFYGLRYNDTSSEENKDEEDVSYFEFSDDDSETMLDYWSGPRRLQTEYVLKVLDFNLGVCFRFSGN